MRCKETALKQDPRQIFGPARKMLAAASLLISSATASAEDAVVQQTEPAPALIVDGSSPAEASPEPGLRWFNLTFAGEEKHGALRAELLFGIPETDAIQFSATCGAQAGAIEAVISADVQTLKPGATTAVTFSANGFEQTLQGTIVVDETGEGQQGARLVISSEDPIWRKLPVLNAIVYSIGGSTAAELPLQGSAVAIAAFLRDCNEPAGAAPQEVDAARAESSCTAKGDARSTEDGAPVTLTFVNRSGEYRVVERIEASGSFAGVAHLQPGETFATEAKRSHVWMMRDGPGNCIEVLPAPRDGSALDITLQSPGFGDDGD